MLADIFERIKDLKDKSSPIEDKMVLCAIDNREVNLLMTIPGIGVYSVISIGAEIAI